MTFKLYRITTSHSVYYDYSINDLAGYYDSPSLSSLTESIVNNQALILKEYVNLADYHKNTDDNTPHAMTIIFTKDYYDVMDLYENLYIDLQQQFPEKFI